MRVAVKGYEGLYEIDEDSVLYSLERITYNTLGRKVYTKSCVRKPIFNKFHGYMTITLCKNGKTKTFRYHRLVAECFIENPQGKPFVNHINGDKTDNRIENLEWVTEQENTDHAIKTNLFDVSGCNNPSSKLTMEQIKIAAERIRKGELISSIAFEFGVNRNAITKSIKRELGGHGIDKSLLKSRGWVGRSRIKNVDI